MLTSAGATVSVEPSTPFSLLRIGGLLKGTGAAAATLTMASTNTNTRIVILLAFVALSESTHRVDRNASLN
jgi:hypothetical protein